MKRLILAVVFVTGGFAVLYAGAFHDYAKKCNYVMVKKFIDNGIDVNSTDSQDMSALYYVLTSRKCGRGAYGDRRKYALVKLLVDNKADFKSYDENDDWDVPDFFYAYNCGTQAVNCYKLFEKNGANLLIKIKALVGDYCYIANPLSIIFKNIQYHNFNFYFDSKSTIRNVRIILPAIEYLLKKGVDSKVYIPTGGSKDYTMKEMAFNIGYFRLAKLFNKYEKKKEIIKKKKLKKKNLKKN